VITVVAGSIAWGELLVVVLAPITIAGMFYLAACAFLAYDEGRLVGLPSWTNAGRAYGALLVPVILILMFGEPQSTLTDLAGAAAGFGFVACGVFAIWIVGRSALTAINAWHRTTAAGTEPDRRAADTGTQRLRAALGEAGVDETAIAIVIFSSLLSPWAASWPSLRAGVTPDTPTPPRHRLRQGSSAVVLLFM
jgi:hypothetical protein